MARIKIISDPYRQLTEFWSQTQTGWEPVCTDTCPNSRLLNEDLQKGFFPFKARQIIDILIEEYSTEAEPVEVLFEGTDDEFRELEAICSAPELQGRVQAEQAERYLENARDILPDIVEVFRALRPLVEGSAARTEKLQKELLRFSDASNDVIPICVIGNYSSGKSTFINALVGYELLPSSDEPTTAKIYRISQSIYDDTAIVRFTFDKKPVFIRLRSDSCHITADLGDEPLLRRIRQQMEELPSATIPRKLNAVLEAINAYANEEAEETISDLIEVDAPALGDLGLWSRYRHHFVIFDTPGSNSASNRKHYEVLKKAMEDLTNGLPIFVSEYTTLDSTDNDHLYQDINNMEELDNRFTMIVVNKADAARLKREGFTEADRAKILGMAIPGKLYSGGIYFVSSVIGLGAKNGGEFANEYYEEIYDDHVDKFIDPTHKPYRTLYRYNILPTQIKKRQEEMALRQSNLLYANSGLYSVEQAISTFAAVYSPYNKCQQSELFLGKIIRITLGEIAEKKSAREEQRSRIRSILDEGRERLLSQIEETSEIQQTAMIEQYNVCSSQLFGVEQDSYRPEELREQEKKLRREKSDEKNMDQKWSELGAAFVQIGEHLKENMVQTVREKNLSGLRRTGEAVLADAQKFNGSRTAFSEARSSVNAESSDDMLVQIRERFNEKWMQTRKALEQAAQSFWAEHTEQFKKHLLELVTNSTALQDGQREKLRGIIMEYHEMEYILSTDQIFDKSKFLYRFFGNPERINLNALARQYNKYMKAEVQTVAEDLRISLNGSFVSWCNNLVGLIRDNIVELNPDLYTHSKSIAEETERIEELETRIQMLRNYENHIKGMMSWKEA